MTSMRLIIPIVPMGAVRMTRRGKWVNRKAQEYLDYKTAVGTLAKQQARLETPLQTAVCIREVIYVMPIPKSGMASYEVGGKRKKRKVQPGDFHTAKPDIDNLFKGLTDALNGIIWKDDSLICEIGRQVKIYGEKPRIEIEVVSA